MQTNKPHDRTLIILLGVGAGILLLAALGLFLIQNPDAPMPWEKPTQTSTVTVIPPTVTETQTPVPTSTGTRRPTRTPVSMTDTPAPTGTNAPASSPTPASTTALPTSTFTPAVTPSPTNTQVPAQPSATQTPLSPTATDTSEATATTAASATLSPTPLDEPILITGIVVDQDTPIANVTVTLEGPTVQTAISNADGAYQFQVDWVDEKYSVVFSLEANPQLNPTSNYVTWSWIEGLLAGDIEMPDLEISAAPRGDLFEQIFPTDGGSYSASDITFENPLTFSWTPYPQAEQYWVDLGHQGEEQTAWQSTSIMDEFVDFNGTLKNGQKINEGTYWWAVGTIKSEPGFRLVAYTHNWILVITP